MRSDVYVSPIIVQFVLAGGAGTTDDCETYVQFNILISFDEAVAAQAPDVNNTAPAPTGAVALTFVRGTTLPVPGADGGGSAGCSIVHVVIMSGLCAWHHACFPPGAQGASGDAGLHM